MFLVQKLHNIISSHTLYLTCTKVWLIALGLNLGFPYGQDKNVSFPLQAMQMENSKSFVCIQLCSPSRWKI